MAREEEAMSAKAIESVLKWVLQGDAHSDALAALKELETIRNACVELERWNRERNPIDLDAARAFGVIEAIAKESK